MTEKSKIISEIFDDFVASSQYHKYESFDSKYIYSHQLWKWNNKIGLKPYLVEAGINPDCVFSSKRGFYKKNNVFLNKIIDELIVELGRDHINAGTMDTSQKIFPLHSLRTEGRFDRTDQINFPLKKIKLQNIQVSLCRTFNCKWKDILIMTKNEDIERKISKNSSEEVLINYEKYKDKYKIESYTSLVQDQVRKNNSVLWKQILKIINELNFQVNYSSFFIGITCLEHLKKEGQLPKKEFLMSKKTENDFTVYLSNQNEVRWDRYPEILQDIVLGMYVKGSSIYGDDNKTSMEKRVTYKIRHWKGKKSKDIYKNSGIMINELQSIKSILDTKYDRKQIYDKFRDLLDKTITTGINHLSREYIEENEKEFMNSCFKVERIKTNNWGKVLELYGINGDLFLPDRLDVSNRGIKFERLIKNLFSEYLNLRSNRGQLKDKIDFWYKKKQENMIPDFTFMDKIIDTKFSIGYSKEGFHHDQVTQQLEKYHKAKKDIIILTFNQSQDIVNFNNRATKIINLKSLKKFMNENFDVYIDDYDIKYIFEEINNIKFFRKYS